MHHGVDCLMGIAGLKDDNYYLLCLNALFSAESIVSLVNCIIPSLSVEIELHSLQP